jgi:hypothetical protein
MRGSVRASAAGCKVMEQQHTDSFIGGLRRPHASWIPMDIGIHARVIGSMLRALALGIS